MRFVTLDASISLRATMIFLRTIAMSVEEAVNFSFRLVTGVTVPFLHSADELFGVAFDAIKVVVC